MKKIAGISINYNSEEETVACLDSLKKLSLADINFTCYIIDNASKKESQDYVEKHLAESSYQFPVEFIKNSENTGFSGGNNVGIKKALTSGADYILVLNNDTVVDEHLLEKMVKGMEENNQIGISSPKIYFYKGSEFHKDRYKENELGKVIWYGGGILDLKNVYGSHRGVDEVDNGQYDKAEKTDFATGCCMLIRKEVFEKIGYFDEEYFLYFEDIDLCMRAKHHGFQIWYLPQGFLWHKNAGSTGGSGSDLQDYFMSRNRLLFGFHYTPLRTKIALMREALKSIVIGRTWQKKGIQDFFFKKFGKGSYKA